MKKVSEIVKALPSLERVIISPLLNIDNEYNDSKFIQFSDVKEKFFTEDIDFEPLNSR